jgi:hypothetical protein
MKFYRLQILLAALLLIVICSSTNSQVKTYSTKFKPAAFIAQWDFSYTLPLPSAMGDVGELFTMESYGLKMGVGAHMTFKLPTNKKGTIRPYLTLGYDLLMNSNDKYAFLGKNVLDPGHFPAQPGDVGPVPGTSKLWMHDFNAALGFEYAFMNKTKWTPFMNLDFGLNMLFATYRQTPTSSTIPGEISFTMKNAPRFGFGFGGGVDGRLTRAFGIVIGVKYRMANLLGAQSKQSDEVNKFYLNDKKDATIGVPNNRFINLMNFYLGAVFYVGKK